MSGPTDVAVPRLLLRGDRLHAVVMGKDEPVPVRLVCLAPVSQRGGPIALLGPDKKCLATLAGGVTDLDAESRPLAERELSVRYGIAAIIRIHRTTVDNGLRYFDAETSLGRRTFLIRDPGTNITHADDGDRLLIRDVAGNRYEIASLRALDAASQAWVAMVL